MAVTIAPVLLFSEIDKWCAVSQHIGRQFAVPLLNSLVFGNLGVLLQRLGLDAYRLRLGTRAYLLLFRFFLNTYRVVLRPQSVLLGHLLFRNGVFKPVIVVDVAYLNTHVLKETYRKFRQLLFKFVFNPVAHQVAVGNNRGRVILTESVLDYASDNRAQQLLLITLANLPIQGGNEVGIRS